MGTRLPTPQRDAETSNRGMDIQRKSLTRSAPVRQRRCELVVDLEEGGVAGWRRRGCTGPESVPLRVGSRRAVKRTRRRLAPPPRPWILTGSLARALGTICEIFSAQTFKSGH